MQPGKMDLDDRYSLLDWPSWECLDFSQIGKPYKKQDKNKKISLPSLNLCQPGILAHLKRHHTLALKVVDRLDDEPSTTDLPIYRHIYVRMVSGTLWPSTHCVPQARAVPQSTCSCPDTQCTEACLMPSLFYCVPQARTVRVKERAAVLLQPQLTEEITCEEHAKGEACYNCTAACYEVAWLCFAFVCLGIHSAQAAPAAQQPSPAERGQPASLASHEARLRLRDPARAVRLRRSLWRPEPSQGKPGRRQAPGGLGVHGGGSRHEAGPAVPAPSNSCGVRHAAGTHGERAHGAY